MASNENSNLEELKKSIENIGFVVDMEDNELIVTLKTGFTKNILVNGLDEIYCSGSLDKNNPVLEGVLNMVVEKVSSIQFKGATKSEVEQEEMLKKQPADEETLKDKDISSEPVVEESKPEQPSEENAIQSPDLDFPPIPGAEDSSSQSKGKDYSKNNQAPPPPPGGEQQKSNSQKRPEASVEERSEESIKDVQILAINTQLELNKADYKELVSEAFTEAGIEFSEVPPLEQLTYQQAIEVIKYGNRKFKK